MRAQKRAALEQYHMFRLPGVLNRVPVAGSGGNTFFYTRAKGRSDFITCMLVSRVMFIQLIENYCMLDFYLKHKQQMLWV